MISWQGLLASSRQEAASPVADSVRRSVSTAYYAMFHVLAASNADCLVGPPQGGLGQHAWLRAYRGMDHREARRYLNQDRQLFSPPVQRFIDTFGELQDARHAADYDPSRAITPSEATNWLDRAEAAIGEFVQVDRNERTAVAIQALVRRRPQ
jgi:hypothetical protein